MPLYWCLYSLSFSWGILLWRNISLVANLRESRWVWLFCLLLYFNSRPVFLQKMQRSGRKERGLSPLPNCLSASHIFASHFHHICFSSRFCCGCWFSHWCRVVAWLINLRLISFDFRLSIGWNKDSLFPPSLFQRTIRISSADLTLAKNLSHSTDQSDTK